MGVEEFSLRQRNLDLLLVRWFVRLAAKDVSDDRKALRTGIDVPVIAVEVRVLDDRVTNVTTNK